MKIKNNGTKKLSIILGGQKYSFDEGETVTVPDGSSKEFYDKVAPNFPDLVVEDLFSGDDAALSAAMAPKSGATVDRPEDAVVGEMYFDTDLGQPIWYDGEAWVDATGGDPDSVE